MCAQYGYEVLWSNCLTVQFCACWSALLANVDTALVIIVIKVVYQHTILLKVFLSMLTPENKLAELLKLF